MHGGGRSLTRRFIVSPYLATCARHDTRPQPSAAYCETLSGYERAHDVMGRCDEEKHRSKGDPARGMDDAIDVDVVGGEGCAAFLPRAGNLVSGWAVAGRRRLID